VIGVTTAIVGRAQGLCFAIGADTAVDVVTRIMRDGKVRRSRLGLGGQTTMLDARLAARLRREGSAVMVSEVQPGGPAARAGLQAGDVVLDFAGASVRSVDDLHRSLTAERAGQATPVRIVRGAHILSFDVVPELDA
jgi:S1-C subfamily serine protease